MPNLEMEESNKGSGKVVSIQRVEALSLVDLWQKLLELEDDMALAE